MKEKEEGKVSYIYSVSGGGGGGGGGGVLCLFWRVAEVMLDVPAPPPWYWTLWYVGFLMSE